MTRPIQKTPKSDIKGSNPPQGDHQVTALLKRWEHGDQNAKARLLELAYDELRQIAGRLMRNERADHTLQATALLNEAAVRVLGANADASQCSRAYFFGAMATTMRRVLIDHARTTRAQRRGGGWGRVSIDAASDLNEGPHTFDLIELNDALEQLEKANLRQGQVVTLRFFGGLTVREVAEHLGISATTVEKDWRFARAWLIRQLGGE